MFDLVNGFAVNGWDRTAAVNAIKDRAEVNNEWYVLVYDMKSQTGNYEDDIEFTDAKTAYKKFDSMKDKISKNQRLEIIWSPCDPCYGDNVVVNYYLGGKE